MKYNRVKLDILKLRSEGKTYNEIVKILGCSKSTVSYHCGDNQKEKTTNRTNDLREQHRLIKKIDNFLRAQIQEQKIQNHKQKKAGIYLSTKIQQFLNRETKHMSDQRFNRKDLIEKIGDKPKCYLTGKEIDLSISRSYHLDHIIPVSRGGDNSIDNCGIACREANNAKSDLMVDEFIELCKSVLEHNGYDVIPKYNT